jgi:hypothetical protein
MQSNYPQWGGQGGLNEGKKGSLCPPYRNFILSDHENTLERFHEKVQKCGQELNEYVDRQTNELVTFPIYCDNRSCDNPECKDHRLYKYKKEHGGQIEVLQKTMNKPKGWVFSGWVIPYEDYDRRMIQDKLIELYRLLSHVKYGSVTEFSIHMELKTYGVGHKNYGCVYLHFHVVCGGLKDLRYVRHVWGRQIRYEDAIRPEDLAHYVSKYASKTPHFATCVDQDVYHVMTYKLQMHRFSVTCERFEKMDGRYILMDVLIHECKKAVYRDSWLCPDSRKNYYFAILDDRPPTGPKLFEVDECNNYDIY